MSDQLLNSPSRRILLLQIFRPSTPGASNCRFDASLGILSSIVRRQGHETTLLSVCRADDAALRHRINTFRPDLIYADIDTTGPDLARRVLGHVDRKYGIHTVAGGLYPTVEPSEALSLPGVKAIIVGESERSFPEYLAEHASGEPGEPVPGVWYRDERGIVHTETARMTTDLDELPFADRSLFENGSPATNGSVRTVVIGRGCPKRCAYCPNERVSDLYAGRSEYVRRRSPEDICDEIDDLCLNYPETSRIRFPDHHFAMDAEWLGRFARLYAVRCGVPFVCHLRAPSVSEEVADLLAEAGCVEAEIEVVSGSDFVRNDILNMEVSDEQFQTAFARLQQRGIHTRAVVLVGAPYATEMSSKALVQLVEVLQPDTCEVKVYHPLPGTKGLDLCREAGWLSNRGEDNFTLQRSILDMPNLPARTIDRTVRRLRSGSDGRWWTAFGRLRLPRKQSVRKLLSNLLPFQNR